MCNIYYIISKIIFLSYCVKMKYSYQLDTSIKYVDQLVVIKRRLSESMPYRHRRRAKQTKKCEGDVPSQEAHSKFVWRYGGSSSSAVVILVVSHEMQWLVDSKEKNFGR